MLQQRGSIVPGEIPAPDHESRHRPARRSSRLEPVLSDGDTRRRRQEGEEAPGRARGPGPPSVHVLDGAWWPQKLGWVISVTVQVVSSTMRPPQPNSTSNPDGERL